MPGPIKLYTVEELAEILRCERQVVYRLVREGSVPHMRVGRLIRFEADAIARWIEQESTDR